MLSTTRQGLRCTTLGRGKETVVERALDLGVTVLDTADMYGSGVNEEVVGQAIRHRRDEVFLGTKFGCIRGEGGSWSIRGDAAYVRTACEASLRRLGVDYIDLYYLHTLNPLAVHVRRVRSSGPACARGQRPLGKGSSGSRQDQRAGTRPVGRALTLVGVTEGAALAVRGQ
jgi:aryl-alcohol dehydrogenase-like predicted oxidoreductase